MYSTYAVVIRLHAVQDLRKELGLQGVSAWEPEVQSILRMATAKPEDALLEVWQPQGFQADTALANVRTAQALDVMRNAHKRGLVADTPKELQSEYSQLWLKQRACMPFHAGLLLKWQKDKAEYAVQVPAQRLREAQEALHYDMRDRYVVHSVPRLLESPDLDRIFRRLGWAASADQALSSYGQSASWLVRASMPPPQASLVLELSGSKHTLQLEPYLEPAATAPKTAESTTWAAKLHL
eukprot:489256-Amphidinium_carterae.1